MGLPLLLLRDCQSTVTSAINTSHNQASGEMILRMRLMWAANMQVKKTSLNIH